MSINNPKKTIARTDPKIPPAKQATINGMLHLNGEIQFDKNHIQTSTPTIPKYIKMSSGKNSIRVGNLEIPPNKSSVMEVFSFSLSKTDHNSSFRNEKTHLKIPFSSYTFSQKGEQTN